MEIIDGIILWVKKKRYKIEMDRLGCNNCREGDCMGKRGKEICVYDF